MVGKDSVTTRFEFWFNSIGTTRLRAHGGTIFSASIHLENEEQNRTHHVKLSETMHVIHLAQR